MTIPSFKVNLPSRLKREIKYNIETVLESGMYASGNFVNECESKIKKIVKARYVFATASGSSALECCAYALKKEYGLGTVLIPANTFIATATAFQRAGFDTEFYPNDLTTIKIPTIKRKKYKGVVIVDLGGIIPYNIKRVIDWAHTNNMWTCEDACQSFGSYLDKKYAGTYADVGAYSFFATKVISSGEGGAMVTNNSHYAKYVRFYRDFGRINPWISKHYKDGWNCRMNEFGAAVLSAQLDQYNEILKDRKRIRERYRQKLGKENMVHFLPYPKKSFFFNGYKIILFLENKVDKDKFTEFCLKKEVKMQGNIYDVTLPEQPIYKNLKITSDVKWINALRRMICLPSYYGMSNKEIDYVAKIVSQSLKKSL